MKISASAYQFLSRANIAEGPVGEWNTSPKQRPDFRFTIRYDICVKPFELNFASLIASRPSIGVDEYVDPVVDKYFSRRWPICLRGRAELQTNPDGALSKDDLRSILTYLRVHLWTRRDTAECPRQLSEAVDQLSAGRGYRRQWFHHQILDIDGDRWPHSAPSFVPTDVAEYVGPGVVTIDGSMSIELPNELVWSQILPFPNPTKASEDWPLLQTRLRDFSIHLNSHDELDLAARELENGNLKSAVRAGASAVDAAIRYYQKTWGVPDPPKRSSFDQKIEHTLSEAGKPSYRSLNREGLQKVLYLYRARNSMHEGDCYYTDVEGNNVQIRKKPQVADLLRAAEELIFWFETVV